MEELISRVAATAQSDLKLPDEQLPTIKRYVKRAINRIKVFCNREDFLYVGGCGGADRGGYAEGRPSGPHGE